MHPFANTHNLSPGYEQRREWAAAYRRPGLAHSSRRAVSLKTNKNLYKKKKYPYWQGHKRSITAPWHHKWEAETEKGRQQNTLVGCRQRPGWAARYWGQNLNLGNAWQEGKTLALGTTEWRMYTNCSFTYLCKPKVLPKVTVFISSFSLSKVNITLSTMLTAGSQWSNVSKILIIPP